MDTYSIDRQMARELQQKFDNMSFFEEEDHQMAEAMQAMTLQETIFQPQVQQLDERRRHQMRRAPVFVPSEGTSRKIINSNLFIKEDKPIRSMGRSEAISWVKQLDRNIKAFDQRIAIFADVTAAEHDRNVQNESRRDQLLSYIADIDETEYRREHAADKDTRSMTTFADTRE